MEGVKKGTFKREIGDIEVKDSYVASIIVEALLDKGYDVVTHILRDGNQMQIGEKLTISKIEERRY